ncbi:hypothetical protein GE061_007675 [Apolygus lucorum]|uniref:Uncharacterized protein n=1 Tax=Apolygus lucorum TaxID=248454 RepID=A0A6A4K8W8_APOLU|nr:hypothetical protein GE061_007675 [Apolygus lucorum]
MSLLAVLRKSGEMIASYDVPNHSNNLSSLHESMKILQQEVNQTLTSLLEGVETKDGSGDDEMDDDSEDDDSAAINGNKRKCPEAPFNKKLKTS